MDALGNELNRLLVDTYRAAGKIEQAMLEELSDGKLSLAEMRAIECVGDDPLQCEAGPFGLNGKNLGVAIHMMLRRLEVTC